MPIADANFKAAKLLELLLWLPLILFVLVGNTTSEWKAPSLAEFSWMVLFDGRMESMLFDGMLFVLRRQ